MHTGFTTWRLILAVIVAVAAPDRCPGQTPPAGGHEAGNGETALPEDPGPEFAFEKFGGVEYRSGDDYRLTLDVYVPDRPGRCPAILAVHGGSWRSGTKLNWFRHARKLARAGFVVVAINYRHAPQFPFPAQIHDCKAAVRWMRVHADQYHIDPDRIGGIGYSAGGHLVALLGTSDADDGLEGAVPESESGISTRLQAVAVGGAPCNFDWIDDDAKTLNFWLGATRREDPEIWKQATPATWLTVDDPPFYFFHGTRDWLVPDACAECFHRQIQETGIESEFKTWDNGHFGLFSRLEALDPVIVFFRKHLGDQSSQRP